MGFTVTIRPSGHAFGTEGHETVLAAALRSGIGLPYGCKNGACGTCKAKGLEGRWAQGPHSASALTVDEQAQGRLLVCCSRPKTDLLIEARELSGFGDIPIRKMPCRIASIERPAPDVSIVTLQLPPGSAVSESELSQRLGIGRTPIREALQRLARERLVSILPRRGVIVSDINVSPPSGHRSRQRV